MDLVAKYTNYYTIDGAAKGNDNAIDKHYVIKESVSKM